MKKKWEDLTFLQKAVAGVVLMALALLAPEFAMLVQFGGIEVAFAFLLLYLKPTLLWLQTKYSELEAKLFTAYLSFTQSASTKPSVFITQATFCCAALALTGSMALSFSFFMPALLFNSVLV
ncbi:hypothetical protein NJR55_11730 [Idiomarina sp. M1R2S28]|uniref:Uncharacterized protein n=1 Tax=Idiomarina rhizosphaerae TaxID=2961572 RepID=A0A9X2JSV8_9GAMM|nr:hypothetical protein [Idiomarina rhizosphaerae]MCP1340258.1 hypothetical protein [Idiomarina rhizosphaerae]